MPKQETTRRVARKSRGFTLVELMVVVAVLGILAVVGVPGMQALSRANQLSGATGEMTAALYLARSEAVRRNRRISVCATDGSFSNTTSCSGSADWSNWAILDLNETVLREERVIRRETAPNGVQVSGPTAGIQFTAFGMAVTDPDDEPVTVCIPTSNPNQNQRVLTVRVSGAVTSAHDSGGGSCP
jgi:type IV fimbrial biogenesis protein FimT